MQSFTDTVTVKRRKTGIRAKKQDEHNGFRVYPNPASSTCHIAFHRDVEPQAVRLYNRQGELVRHQQVEGGGHVTLPVQQVETGVYMIRIISEKGVHSKQVMIGR